MKSIGRVIGILIGMLALPVIGSAQVCCLDDPPRCLNNVPPLACENEGGTVFGSCHACTAAPCETNLDCDDGSTCTMDFCMGIGQCTYNVQFGTTPCDGGPCTTNGLCDVLGQCQAEAIVDCGACCAFDGTCSEEGSGTCQGIMPGEAACGPIGACCLSVGACVETSESCCSAIYGGSFRSGTCLGDNNLDGVNDACQLCADPQGRSCDDDNVCTFDACGGTDCAQALRRYGDVGGFETCVPDGTVDADDLLAALDAYGTLLDAPECPLHNFDIAGAGGPSADDTVNLDDILAVVDAFQGQADHCDDPLMPLPIIDGDGDGIPATQDPCWFSSTAAATTIPGCTALDVSMMPDTLVAWMSYPISHARTEAEALFTSVILSMHLLSAESVIVDGAPFVRSAGACEGQGSMQSALVDLDNALAELDALRDAAYNMIYPPDPIHADTTPEVTTLLDIEYVQGLVTAARTNIVTMDLALGDVCENSLWNASYSGVVTDVDDVNGLIALDTGGVFALRDDTTSAGISVGMAVNLEVTDIGDGGTGNGAGMVNGIFAEAYDPGPLQYICNQLRFAPIQPFGPLYGGPYELHLPIGYLRDEAYLVEAGMGLAVVDVCPPPPSGWGPAAVERHSVKLILDYQDMDGAARTRNLALDLVERDHPVRIPADVDPSIIATLTVQHQVQECTDTGVGIGLACSAPAPTISQTFDLDIQQRGFLAVAQYQQTEYDVDDQIKGDHREGRIDSVFTFITSDGGFPPLFSAKGYAYPSSACPGVSSILGNGPFAIHSWDFYPIFGPTGGLDDAYYRQLYGVTTPSGLIWPHIGGVKNGAPFWYSCGLPPFVIRDAVNLCATAPNAYYRLPFANNTEWEQSQGNGGEFSHANTFAYDMAAGCGTAIHAARGGIVTRAVETCNIQQVDGPCPNSCGIPNCCAFSFCCVNEVRIKHQDGTVGQYVHFEQNGVAVEVGDRVRRGQFIGRVGSTGFSTGPHLHFAARTGTGTTLALFEARTAVGSSSLRTCYEPQNDDAIISNNQECADCLAPCE